jgi:hypothetical protein
MNEKIIRAKEAVLDAAIRVCEEHPPTLSDNGDGEFLLACVEMLRALSEEAQENDGIALNGKWNKLVVFDMRTNEEIAVVTRDGITTADDAIVVRLTPNPDY